MISPESLEISPINTRMFTHVGSPVPIIDLKAVTASSGKRVYTTPSGNRYPSITTVLGHQEKPWLADWKNMLGVEKAAKETKRASDRGTKIHELAEKYLNNEPNFTRGYDAEYVRGFNQLRLKLNKVDNIRIQEASLYSDTLKVAGRVDCIGEFNGTLCIVDFKTSNNNKDRSMIGDYFLQCTAYAIMWHELTGESIEDVTILMSVEKGIAPLVFQEKIDKYVAPLLKRIDQYYREQE